METGPAVGLNAFSWFGGMEFLRRKWFPVLGLFFLSLPQAASAIEPVAKNVLVLYSFTDRSVFGPPEFLKSALRSRVPWPVNFYVQYLEGRRFESDAAYEKKLADNLRYTYGSEKLDLVIAADYPALQFAVRHRAEIFPGAPIFFMEVHGGRLAGQKMGPGVTGVTETVHIPGTINLALRLHPRTNTVAIITNNSPFEKYWLAAVHAELLHHQDKVREIDLVGLSTDRLMERVATLPVDTVVLFQAAPQESIHAAIGPQEALESIGKRPPIYCIFPSLCLNHGGIGGSETSSEEEMSLAAGLAGRVLAGENPENIPVLNGPAQLRVDWNQLRRWKIPESALPGDTLVLYRPQTLRERDRNYILAAIALIVAQSLLIIGLLWQRARKRKAEAVLRESEQRFRAMADSAPSLIWMADEEGKITYLNSRGVEFTGLDAAAGYGDTWEEYVHPDDLKGVLAANCRALQRCEPFSKEYRLRRHDGVYRWMFDVASPRVNGDGSFAGFIGSATDVTEQNLAQDALEKVSGQLIEAQEKERSRIARDLHDDICQRLALLSMELEQANRSLNGSPAITHERLQEIQLHCAEIAGDVQALSYQLHSSKLDYLGIVAAIRGFCKEFAKQHQVSVNFTDDNVPKHLSKDVSLCLFRVAQEALHNAVKYSGATQFAVELRTVGNKVQLEVGDKGVGFDVEAAKNERGLGLVSMQERVHLVRGRFSVGSGPGKGTRIVATVPLAAEGAWDLRHDLNGEPASATGAA